MNPIFYLQWILIMYVKTQKTKSTILLVGTGRKMVFLSSADIQYISLANGYCVVTTKDEQQYISNKSFNEILEIIDCDNFILISRGVVINISHIDHLYVEEGEVIVMKSGEEFNLARRRKKEFFNVVKRI